MKSIYLHIPFCDTICSYCDFCKQYYEESIVDTYLIALEKEIDETYRGEPIKTLYIGGGTPSCLTISQLKKLLSFFAKFSLVDSCEITFEANIESMNEEKLKLLREYGVNRLSIGIETFQEKLQKVLERKTDIKALQAFLKNARRIGFTNINGDLIYAVPGQTKEDLKKDLTMLLSCNLEHISTYSLMMEPHTKLSLKKIEPIEEEEDASMYQIICKTLKEHGYQHYEISNFSRPSYEAKHNLVYWNNEEYYGFGLGASGYLALKRYENTRSLTKYCKGSYRKEEDILSKKDQMCYEMILGLRKIEGVSSKQFYQKYGMTIEETFPIDSLLEHGFLEKQGEFLRIAEAYLYVSNEILEYFIL